MQQPSDDLIYFSEARGEIVGHWDASVSEVSWKTNPADEILGFGSQAHPATHEWLRLRTVAEDLATFDQGWFRLGNGYAVEFECRLRNADDQPVWCRFTALRDQRHGPDGADMVLSLCNIHELRQAMEDRREISRARTLRNMTAGIAHEFNNHLTPIRGFIELALDSLGEHHPARADLEMTLDRVRSCTELVALIQHAGKHMVLQPRRVNLEMVVTSCLNLAESTGMMRKGIVPRINIDPQFPNVMIDTKAFQEALFHVLRNAIAAMPGGGVLAVRGRPYATTRGDEPDFICLAVMDTGSGIRCHDLPFIFDPFFTTGSRAENKGLGLAMVRGVMERMGGWVEVRSEPESGTEIRLYMPIAPVSEAVPELPADAAFKPGRLLACESDPYVLRLMTKVFEKQGWQVDEIDDLQQAIRNSRTWPERYDLVILDAGPRPQRELIEYLKEIETRPRPAVILLGAQQNQLEADDISRRDEKMLWAPKPFSPRKLVQRAEQLVTRKKPRPPT